MNEKGLHPYPFDSQRLVGTICEVSPTSAKVNLPIATHTESQWFFGNRVGRGEVGEFVVVEAGEFAIFGRIIKIELPERDRLSVEPVLGEKKSSHPFGSLQMLSTINIASGEVTAGIQKHPRLGSRVFSAHPNILKWLAESAQKRSKGSKAPITIDLAYLPNANDTHVCVTPERLFGRHCAVLGATGGGKSWTVARLIECIASSGGKLILVDATGEFHTLNGQVRHVHIGSDSTAPKSSKEVGIPYQDLTEADLMAMFKPSGQSQAPKLRAAMKSLKLIKVAPALATGGLLVKVGREKKPVEDAHVKHAQFVESTKADFNITKLSAQIYEECIYPTGGSFSKPDPKLWGNSNDNERSYTVSLLTRIDDLLQSQEFSCIFKPDKHPSIFTELQEFLNSHEEKILRISLKHLPFNNNAREIVCNAIGRHLLARARNGEFRQKPLIVFLDEAHQFLDKHLGDESSKYPLDSFDLIAKEGRKFSLNICLATQRPRDIPEGVLSQMGTLIVHRLTNEKDREIVEKASGDIDRSAAAFLPTLSPGQAVIVGVDFPIPLTVQIQIPLSPPDSKGPNYQDYWEKQANPASTPTPADTPPLPTMFEPGAMYRPQ